MYFLKLIRLPNLLMMVLTQFLVRYCIIIPAFQTEYNITGEFPDHLSKFDFSLLVLSTILIAAAGYIINDIFDITADEINKPESVVIGKKITEKKARLVYLLLNAVGISISLYLAIKIEHPTMALVQVFIVASLWMYSSYYKRRILSGNFIIALLSALVLIVVGLFEPEFYRNFVFLMAYSGFAFFVSLTREIIKDMEDVEGDEKAQYKTLPVRFGLQKTKGIIYFNLLLTGGLIVLVFYQFFFINKVISFWYLLSMFLIPFLALTYLIYSANEKKDYYYASLFTKIIMLVGILTMIPFYYYFLT
ncbi:MAG: geranylgeranylglycerol-phosphate geranylgeranyltransferase [Bacteroidetes bacterium]|nr:geranylgeranylglycerol-phosphate geranylgeranyltransferase [Bacteroidota bacterium]MBP6400922.1 geranylgeranylglycerol-phosphate geranylgeranyltransferase [Bacteroidia bacterium]MBK9524823.1 geranylgeranylglycerol-phosphate geranylgeranyltransferase [Bacteroidota bacterium]MBK9542989.1 geranylgeranylglycerol-phosphate geranylgeranyltransferase [Bacteroidota bacterium]MBL0257268.1 geranylgeranylglycerol-phosphate geranylgeranyltransferase [Bacteroidota bacterium]